MDALGYSVDAGSVLVTIVWYNDRYGGGSVMVWAGIMAHGQTDLVFIDGLLNTQKYCQEILGCHIAPFMQANGGTFQQGNARPHVARDNMDYLRQHNVDVLPGQLCR